MKKNYVVLLDALKHERDRFGDVTTTLHLELPADIDLRFLQKVHRRSLDPSILEEGEFRLTIEEEGQEARVLALTSKGSKTKDFKLLAVMVTDFSPHANLARYIDTYLGEHERTRLTLSAELLIHQPPLLPDQKADSTDEPSENEGPVVSEVVFSSGNRTVALTLTRGEIEGEPSGAQA